MNDEFHALYLKKMRNDLNGFSWVVDNLIGGMRAPTDLSSVEPVIEKHNIGLVVSLTELPLLFSFGSMDNVINVHLPVTDFGTPKFEQVEEFIKNAKSTIERNKAIAVHCHAGYGRTGVFIACFLVSVMDMDPSEAVTLLRSKRPGSICNKKQESFVEAFKEHWKSTM